MELHSAQSFAAITSMRENTDEMEREGAKQKHVTEGVEKKAEGAQCVSE